MTNTSKWDNKIEVFESEYFFDTLQERKLVLREFAKEVEQETEERILKIIKTFWNNKRQPTYYILNQDKFKTALIEEIKEEKGK